MGTTLAESCVLPPTRMLTRPERAVSKDIRLRNGGFRNVLWTTMNKVRDGCDGLSTHELMPTENDR